MVEVRLWPPSQTHSILCGFSTPEASIIRSSDVLPVLFFKLTYVPFNIHIIGEFCNLNDASYCIIRMFYTLLFCIYLMKWFWNLYRSLYIDLVVFLSSVLSMNTEHTIHYVAHEHLDRIRVFALMNSAVLNILIWSSLSMYERFYYLCILKSNSVES